MRNERGYALILVLVIITITFTFALSMSGMALSTRKQINKTDGLNKATDLAEMGIAHYEALLNRLVLDSNNEARKNPAQFDQVFIQKLTDSVKKATNIPSKQIEGMYSYKVIQPKVNTLSDGSISVSFQTEGKTDNETKLLNTTIKVERKKNSLAGNLMPTPKDYQYHEKNSVNLEKRVKYISYSSTYFEKEINTQGGRLLEIYGNAFFKGEIDIGGSVDIFVYGDAIFMSPPDSNGKSYTFCVTGTPYLVGSDGKLSVYTPFPEGKNSSCTKTINEPSWYIDPVNGIDVTY